MHMRMRICTQSIFGVTRSEHLKKKKNRKYDGTRTLSKLKKNEKYDMQKKELLTNTAPIVEYDESTKCRMWKLPVLWNKN